MASRAERWILWCGLALLLALAFLFAQWSDGRTAAREIAPAEIAVAAAP